MSETEAKTLLECLGWVPDIGWRPMFWSHKREVWESCVDAHAYAGDSEGPTHWMALPAPPEEIA